MHNKIHSVISPLFWIKNADIETGWNVRILRPVWIISAKIRYLLSEQKKFQNKLKNRFIGTAARKQGTLKGILFSHLFVQGI